MDKRVKTGFFIFGFSILIFMFITIAQDQEQNNRIKALELDVKYHKSK